MLPQVLPAQKLQKLQSFAFVQEFMRTHDLSVFLVDLEKYADYLDAEQITASDRKALSEALMQSAQIESVISTFLCDELLYFRGGILRKLRDNTLIPSGSHHQIHIDTHAPALHNLLAKIRHIETLHPHMQGWMATAFTIFSLLKCKEKSLAHLYDRMFDGTSLLDDFVISRLGGSIEKSVVAQWCFEQKKIHASFVLGELMFGGDSQICGFSLLYSHGRYFVLDHEHPLQLYPHWIPALIPITGIDQNGSAVMQDRTYCFHRGKALVRHPALEHTNQQ